MAVSKVFLLEDTNVRIGDISELLQKKHLLLTNEDDGLHTFDSKTVLDAYNNRKKFLNDSKAFFDREKVRVDGRTQREPLLINVVARSQSYRCSTTMTL